MVDLSVKGSYPSEVRWSGEYPPCFEGWVKSIVGNVERNFWDSAEDLKSESLNTVGVEISADPHGWTPDDQTGLSSSSRLASTVKWLVLYVPTEEEGGKGRT